LAARTPQTISENFFNELPGIPLKCLIKDAFNFCDGISHHKMLRNSLTGFFSECL